MAGGRGREAGRGSACRETAHGLRGVPAGTALIAPARSAAYEVIRRVFEHEAYADRAFAAAAAGLDERDRALAQRLAYGTVQRVRLLDHAIETLGKRPVRKLDAPVLAALRLGAYQLAYAEGVPRYAAVNESVELVRRARLERAVPFTNAVMRRVADGIEGLLAALPEGPLKHSYPDWVYETWRDELGEEAALALMRAQNEPPEAVVRVVSGEIDGEPTDVPGAVRVDHIDDAAFAEGRIWPQSRASQLAGLAVGAREGERILDSCAAPGGKATMLAGEVFAVEIHEARARELEENVRRLGATNVRVVNADATDLPPELDGFDRALVDAPCSGLGVLNRRPDLRWRATPLPELQLALVNAAAERVKPGGVLVYAVCTMSRAENEEIVDAAGLEPDPTLADEWPQYRHPHRPEFLLTLPHLHNTNGFFIARLRA
ncbi:MAG: transcription antitermination factor NusB [Gaiellaceae bacterium]